MPNEMVVFPFVDPFFFAACIKVDETLLPYFVASITLHITVIHYIWYEFAPLGDPIYSIKCQLHHLQLQLNP